MVVKSPVQAGRQCAQLAIGALLPGQGHLRHEACLFLLPGNHILRRKGIVPPENDGISREFRMQPGSGADAQAGSKPARAQCKRCAGACLGIGRNGGVWGHEGKLENAVGLVDVGDAGVFTPGNFFVERGFPQFEISSPCGEPDGGTELCVFAHLFGYQQLALGVDDSLHTVGV